MVNDIPEEYGAFNLILREIDACRGRITTLTAGFLVDLVPVALSLMAKNIIGY